MFLTEVQSAQIEASTSSSTVAASIKAASAELVWRETSSN